jgi:hypothetical protein
MLGPFLKTPGQRRVAFVLFGALLVGGAALLWLQA